MTKMKIVQNVPISSAPGNTDLAQDKPDTKQEYPYLYWNFTLNNYDNDDIVQLVHIFDFECDWYLFQEETGESGTPHLQGTIKLKLKQRLTGLKKFNPKIHWEHTKSVKASLVYCQKEKSRTGKIFSKNVQIPKPIKLITPDKWWQLEILELFKTEPNDRLVHWYWSEHGGVGKSQFAKYCVIKENCLFFEEGRKTDIMHLVFTCDESRLERMIIDVPRDNGNNVSYKSIESLKNGLIYSSKYEGGYKTFNSPHIIVFANEEPQIERLSKDRWVIKNIDNIET